MEFWITSKETDLYDIGVFFDVDKEILQQCEMLERPAQFTYQDSVHQEQWKKLSFTFKPKSAYSYVTVGNFKKNKETKRQYLFLDYFFLSKTNPPKSKLTPPDTPISVEEIFNPKNVLFDNGKFDLLPASYPELNKLVAYLAKEKETHIHIEGHTDNSGSPTFNQELSINRANAIRKYLINSGILDHRISILGYGQTRPCLLYTSPSPRDATLSRMPSSA